MKHMSLAAPEEIALQYGGNKKKIAEAIRMQLVDPTAGLMAGLFIDRMRKAAAEEQKTNTTLVQDTFGVQGSGTGTMAGNQLGMQGQQLPQPQPQPQPQMAQGLPAAQMAAAKPQAPAGVEGLPAGDVGNYSMAGGGIVAFGDGGDVPGYAGTNGSLVGGITDAEAIAMGYPNAQAYLAAQERKSLAKTMQDTFNAQGRPDSPVFVKPQAATPANVNASGIQLPNPEANLGIASKQARSLMTVPDELTQEKAIQNKEALNRAMGVKENIYQDQKTELGKDREQLRLDREEAKNMAIFKAGMGILGGTSQYAAVNIGQGSTPAINDLASEIKDIKKAGRELKRAEMALDTAENNYKLDKSKSVETQLENSQARRDKAQQNVASLTGNIASSLNTLAGSQYGAQIQAASVEKQIAGQLEQTGMNNRSAAHVAGIYVKGHEALEKLRQQGMPDAFKLANSPEMQKSMPNSTFKERLEAVSQATHPKDIKNALLNATSQVQKRADEEWANLSITNKEIKALKDKAAKGDVEAQKQLEKRKSDIFDSKLQEFYAGYENMRTGVGGSQADKLPTTRPSMAVFMEEARKVNPNATDQELIDYYNTTYGR
jgi:hypothetical protein